MAFGFKTERREKLEACRTACTSADNSSLGVATEIISGWEFLAWE
jgi:hypothetical protein